MSLKYFPGRLWKGKEGWLLAGFLLPALQGEGVPGPSPTRRHSKPTPPGKHPVALFPPKIQPVGCWHCTDPSCQDPFAGRRQGAAGLAVSPAGGDGEDAAEARHSPASGGVIGMPQLTSLCRA